MIAVALSSPPPRRVRLTVFAERLTVTKSMCSAAVPLTTSLSALRVRCDRNDRVRRFVRDDAVAVAVSAEESDDFPVVLPRKIAGNGNIVPRPRRSAGSGVAGLIQKCRQNPAQYRHIPDLGRIGRD